MTAVAHVAPALAWSVFLPWWLALALALCAWTYTAWRVQRLLGDPPRPRWVTRLLDEPMFLHWAAGLLALPLAALGALALAAASLGGCAPSAVPAHLASTPDAALGALGTGLVVSAWALWGRRRFVQRRVLEVPMRRLHADLDGYRIVQLSDLHIGSYDGKDRGFEWAAMASALEPDLIVVTGDLVTSGTAYYDDVAEVLGALRAKDGVFVVMGNHDQWNNEALTRAIEARGVRVLKNERARIARGDGAFTLAGVDDAYSGSDDIEATLAGRPQALPTVLLAHYPDFFGPAARHGVELTLSGHTHGGQFGVPFLAQRANLATALRQPSRGLFRDGDSVLYVSAGLGTTGPPMRLGVAPEIAVLVLRKLP